MCFRVMLIFSFFALLANNSWSQKPERKLLLLDATVLTSDSLLPVPNAHIISKFNRVGTISNDEGQFNMMIDPYDSLLITSIGFSPLILYITDSIKSIPGTVQILLQKDTLMINEVIIRAFFEYEVFKQMVINMKPIDMSQFYPVWEGTELLYREPTPATFGGPIQALYDHFNHLARLERKLIRNREQYNELMRKMGRDKDTIPAIPEHMQESPR
ncbi:MAG: hypothetical protein COW63_13250 [Bacteroidetes bacterium CG18_big_fil_WC_8_21_14_2_50_41_14]|nr:MAG: hypothetical protein COW63_13250 [Bacteroidetes bacterium CG18_big_fil_WC_8_21_14_2_50_41_14]PIY34354.1 MAG: hypothetical protein COZ08_02360 [Bacteroidetes bacterium CG_4_10_14_3_um_filter_42_6]PJB59378.1 MAG: hypothetical protein CO098_03700 [Bacteroidetes bacterium CG_4_9_14_3_um_filter_41_19]